MKAVLVLLVGVALGFGIAVKTGHTERQTVRIDQVTLTKEELEHVVRAIALLKDDSPSPGYARYVSDSGSIAFDCPSAKACNLQVPAREEIKPNVLHVVENETELPKAEPTPTHRAITGTATHTHRVERPETVKLRRDDAFHRLGLLDGDVVTAVNGVRVSSTDEVLTQLSELSVRTDLREVSVIRDGKPLTLRF